MERIALVTDSTCDLPAEMLAEHQITMVPLRVFFGDEEYRDNIDLTPDAFYRKLAAAKELPTTSQPSPGEFLAAFQKLQQEGYTHVLCLLITSTFSGTQQSAAVAAKMTAGLTIEIIDSRTVTWALGMLLLYTRELIKSGLNFSEAAAKVREQVKNIVAFFTTESLDALQRGGRIGKAAALVGKIFGVRPLLSLSNGSGMIEPVKKLISHPVVVAEIMNRVREHVRTRGVQYGVTLIYTRPELIQDMLRELQNSGLELKQLLQGAIGPVIGTHLGPDGWGVVIF